MKIKKLLFIACGCAATFGMLSFNGGTTTLSKSAHTDSLKIKQANMDALLKADVPENLRGVLFDRPVNYHYVKPCLDAFAKYGVMPSVQLSQSVSFGRADLTKWLNEIPEKTDCTDVRVCFGLYTKEFLEHYKVPNADKLVNRLTVFLVPYYNENLSVYKKGKDKGNHGGEADSVIVDSFNLGNVRP